MKSKEGSYCGPLPTAFIQINRSLGGLILSLALLLIFSLPQVALAIGPGTGGSNIRVNDEEYDPFVLLVATSPSPLMVGQMSVWVRVTGLEDKKLLRNATVIIEAVPDGGGSPVIVQGTHKNAGNDFDYVAHLEIEQPGQWNINISIEDTLGEAQVSFTETVSRDRNIWTLITLAIPFVVIAIAVGIFLWRRSAA